eukprot:TRINITY_DN21889_c0_g4_i1.p1 TRINITY_DN21889_c0_g4~~TRINITY_DN21889_c0_g4_i1.p1  ORF type:complete len:303 (-),score=34.37 TRINITY_DN21889_c0_g4_i1:134-1042(-)
MVCLKAWHGVLHVWESITGAFHNCAHRGTQQFVQLATEDSKSARWTRFIFALGNIAFGGMLFYQGHLYRQNLDATFWMGILPHLTLLECLFAQAAAFTITVRIRIIQYYRSERQKASKHRGDAGRECCEPAPNFLRVMLMKVALLAIGALVLGFLVIDRGNRQVKELTTQCGVEGTSKEINEVQSSLVKFQRDCRATPQQSKFLVHQCPGFMEAFPGDQPFVDYLARLEVSDHCSGFCTKPADRMFTTQPPRSAGQRELAQPCVQLVKRRVKLSSFMVGGVSICTGVLVFLGSWLLFDYAHL